MADAAGNRFVEFIARNAAQSGAMYATAGFAGLAAAGEKKLAQRALSLAQDSKLEAFLTLVEELGASEKVLVFAEPRETIEYLRAEHPAAADAP